MLLDGRFQQVYNDAKRLIAQLLSSKPAQERNVVIVMDNRPLNPDSSHEAITMGASCQAAATTAVSALKTTATNPYIHAATAHNTRKAYRADIQHFEQWGGTLPASVETLAKYLQQKN